MQIANLADARFGTSRQLMNQVVVYEQSTQIFMEDAHLWNRTRLSYIKLVLVVNAKLQKNKDRICILKDNLKGLSDLAKEANATLATAVEVQKANELQTDKNCQQIRLPRPFKRQVRRPKSING
ncbi:hypothetical protein R1flu_016499 [Riccia fluitans]|uniref:Uncharacterized protein n=1 Tax=Riccia fluitans TaxID=41844 RepID=A0ABD1YM79_9MARC